MSDDVAVEEQSEVDAQGTDLAVSRTVPAPVTEAARKMFSEDQVLAVKQTVAKGCTDAELVLFLEICARYQLDPFAGQVWAANMGGSGNGLTIMVGRDGYLAYASRNTHFTGLTGDVVHENDSFSVSWETTASGAFPNVSHVYPPDTPRGAIVGAWSIAYRDDRAPTYFFAPIGEYKKEYKKTSGPWGKQVSAMVLKCAQSTVLRLAFNISGTTPADEGPITRDGTVINGEPVVPVHEEPNWGEDEALAAKLQSLFASANDLRLGAFPPAKIKLVLADRDHAGLEQVAAQMEDWIEKRLDQVAVEDAEVVE